MILSTYLGRRFARALLAMTGTFALILGSFELVDALGDTAEDGAATWRAFRLTLLVLPEQLYEVAPLIVLLATLALFLALARSSELVVARAAGRSALAAIQAPVLVMLVVGALLVAVANPIVAATSREAEKLSDLRDGGNVLSISREGLWLRQGGEDGQTVIRAAAASLDGAVLREVSFVAFEAGSGPVRRTDAARAELGEGAWRLRDVKSWDLAAPNPEASATRAAGATLPTDLTADRIRDSFGTPSAVPIWELPAFVADLERAGFSARAHRMWMWSELASPLFYAAMVIVGAAFTLRHARAGRTGLRIGGALLLGFALYFVKDFAAVLGEAGQIPVHLAAIAPPVAALMLSVALVLHLEDG